MTKHKKICLIVLVVPVVATGGMYLWNTILDSNLRPEEIPYLHPSDDELVDSVTFDPQGNAWVYGDFGIRVYNDQGIIISEFTAENTPAFQYAEEHFGGIEIKFDQSGRPWLMAGDQLYLWNDQDWIVYTPDSLSLQNAYINSLIFDTRDRLWLGTNNSGLIFADSQSVVRYTTGNSDLTSNSIRDITQDKSDRIWVATWGGGINIYDGVKWQSFNQNNSPLISDYVYTISLDEQGHAWIGTAGGISIYNGDTWQTYNTENSGLLQNDIVSIMFDDLDRAWLFSTGGIDITVFDGVRWRYYFVPSGFYDRLWFNFEWSQPGKIYIVEKLWALRSLVTRTLVVSQDIKLTSYLTVW